MIIGMECLEKYEVVLNYSDKTFIQVAKDQIVRNIEDISKNVSLRQISSMQLKKCLTKVSNIYAVKATNLLLSEDKK